MCSCLVLSMSENELSKILMFAGEERVVLPFVTRTLNRSLYELLGHCLSVKTYLSPSIVRGARCKPTDFNAE
jgi:hypothetical protein